MSRRKDLSIPDSVLDQLLAGTNASAAFGQGGIFDALKKAVSNWRGFKRASVRGRFNYSTPRYSISSKSSARHKNPTRMISNISAKE